MIYLFNEKYDLQNIINADFKHFILNLFLVQEWGLKTIHGTFNSPSWSISVEILMYMIFFYFALKNNFIINSLILIFISSILYFKSKYIGYGGYCFFIGGLSYLLSGKIKIKDNYKIILY